MKKKLKIAGAGSDAEAKCTLNVLCQALSSLIVFKKYSGETYRAKAYLETAGKPVEIDCRPSDGLATPLEQAHRYLSQRRF